MTLHPERGGSAVMARYAFNELLSFVAGWAILLDFLILIAISTLSIGHYLTAFWSEFGDDGVDLAIALLRAVHRRPLQLPRQGAPRAPHDRAVDHRPGARAADRRRSGSPRRSTRRAITDNVQLGDGARAGRTCSSA